MVGDPLHLIENSKLRFLVDGLPEAKFKRDGGEYWELGAVNLPAVQKPGEKIVQAGKIIRPGLAGHLEGINKIFKLAVLNGLYTGLTEKFLSNLDVVFKMLIGPGFDLDLFFLQPLRRKVREGKGIA